MSEIDWTKRKVWTYGQILAEKERLRAEEPAWRRDLDRQHWIRRQLLGVAYGVEVLGEALMLHADWECVGASLNRSVGTGDPELDEFFLLHFSVLTTSWVHRFPDQERAAAEFNNYKQLAHHFCALIFRKDYQDRLLTRL